MNFLFLFHRHPREGGDPDNGRGLCCRPCLAPCLRKGDGLGVLV